MRFKTAFFVLHFEVHIVGGCWVRMYAKALLHIWFFLLLEGFFSLLFLFSWFWSVIHRIYVICTYILVLTFYSTRLARQKFYLEKKLSSEFSQVKLKNGSLEFSLLCFKWVPSTRRVFLKEHCNFYASTENVLPY